MDELFLGHIPDLTSHNLSLPHKFSSQYNIGLIHTVRHSAIMSTSKPKGPVAMNFYEELQAPQTANKAEIWAAYSCLVLRLDPETHCGQQKKKYDPARLRKVS